MSALPCGTPPPPPPPPNMAPLKGLSLKNIVGAVLMIAQEPTGTSREQFRRKLKVTIEKDIPELSSKVLLSSIFPVCPIMQDGPCCGIVALAMAAQMLSKETTASHVLQTSQNLGFSLQGELFSAYNLAKLAEETLNCTSEVLDMRDSESKGSLLRHLANSHPVLVPYDGDGNNAPCLKNGHKAHWALLTGFLASIPKPLGINNSLDITEDIELCPLYHIKSKKFVPLHDQIVGSPDVFVYGIQGKSRNVSLWPLHNLLASNANLREVDPNREAETGQYLIPQEGIQSVLCNKIVILHS